MSKVGILAVSTPLNGGTFQYTISMIDALRRLSEHECTIFTVADNHYYDNLGMPIVYLPNPISATIRAVATRLLRAKRFDPFRSVDKAIAPIYSLRLLGSRRPFAFTLHDLQEKYFPRYFTIAQRAWRAVVNRSLSHAAAIIVCESGHVKSDIERFLSVNASRIAIIAAPPVSAFSQADLSDVSLQNTRVALGLPGSYIFYPAQFFPHKNHLRLIDAFASFNKRFPQCHLVLTGKEHLEFDKVMSRVQELHLTQSVTHLGYVETKHLAAIYKLATLVVVPTLFESVSIPIYEAFIVGTPVCASNVVALPEQVGDAAVLFDPTSVPDIARAIGDTFADSALRTELVIRGKRRIFGLSMENYAKELAALLERVE
jgi:glycosyltransferase involved in cell wall biosynthesis